MATESTASSIQPHATEHSQADIVRVVLMRWCRICVMRADLRAAGFPSEYRLTIIEVMLPESTSPGALSRSSCYCARAPGSWPGLGRPLMVAPCLFARIAAAQPRPPARVPNPGSLPLPSMCSVCDAGTFWRRLVPKSPCSRTASHQCSPCGLTDSLNEQTSSKSTFTVNITPGSLTLKLLPHKSAFDSPQG